MSKPTRRDFLKTGALSTLFLGAGAAVNGCSPVQAQGSARNVIFMVSDGMSSGTLTMADVMLRRRDNRPSNWIRNYEEARLRRSLMDMASANRIVTDSSAASSSWGCGHRINNGAVNIGVNGERHTPVLPIFRDAGKSTGLVTTAEITHATPAGFAANVESRSEGEEIASQYLEREVDLLLGGGNRHFDASMRSDGRDLYAEFESQGYHVARHKDDLQVQAARDGKLVGTFSNGHLPYTLDHVNTPELEQSVPTLAELTELAIGNLSQNQNGFILQVEGGRIDHAAHSNDIGGLIFDQIAFDDAIGVVLDFAMNRDDTLVIITTDHGNANPGFNSSPDRNFDQIADFTHTNDWIRRELNENSSISQIRERIEAATGLEVSRDEAQAYLDSVRGTYTTIYNRMTSPSAVMGQILANHTDTNFIGGSHTADYVELASYGPGSEALGGFVRNTDLFTLMLQAAGIPEGVS